MTEELKKEVFVTAHELMNEFNNTYFDFKLSPFEALIVAVKMQKNRILKHE